MFSEQKSENFNGGKMRSENMFKIDFNNNNNNKKIKIITIIITITIIIIILLILYYFNRGFLLS